jgi:uncharacterized protein (UPF0333 family)
MNDNSKFAEQQCKNLKIPYVKIIKGKYYYFDNGRKTEITKKYADNIQKETDKVLKEWFEDIDKEIKKKEAQTNVCESKTSR